MNEAPNPQELMDVAKAFAVKWARQFPRYTHLLDEMKGEATLAAVEASREFDGSTQFMTFAYTKMLVRVRAMVGAFEDAKSTPWRQAVAPTGPVETPADTAMDRLLVRDIERAMEALAPEDARVMSAYMEVGVDKSNGSSVGNIASRLGLTVDATKARAKRARKLMRSFLQLS